MTSLQQTFRQNKNGNPFTPKKNKMANKKDHQSPTFNYHETSTSRLDELTKIWLSYFISGDSMKGPLFLKKPIPQKTESLYRKEKDLSLTNSKITDPLEAIVERQFPSTQVSIKGNFW